nr:hypothetical protein JVH1_8775 [Rhodococcus sp. JVH1]
MIGAGDGANCVDWTKTAGSRDSVSSGEQAQLAVAIATRALAPIAAFLTLMIWVSPQADAT